MSDAILKDHEARIRRLEELRRPKRLKSKRMAEQELWLTSERQCAQASMAEKGWNQSDLAGKIWGYKTDRQGKRVAIGKDKISVWFSGKTCPSPKQWALLAQFVDLV